MDTKELVNELRKKWRKVHIQEDKPNEFYEKHFHPFETKIIILEGDMAIKLGDKKLNFEEGDEIIIRANEEHEVKIGNSRCKYIIAEVQK